jgi:hypothetical protein
MKETREALHQALCKRLEPLGFKYKASEHSHLRPIAVGRHSFHIAYHYYDHLCVAADVAVRLDELEDLLNTTRSWMSPREKRATYSLGAELGNIAGTGYRSWDVPSLDEVDRVADDVVASFKAIGLPYLERASTLESAYRLLTSPGRSAWLHAPFHWDRAACVVGLAMLTNREQKLPQIVENCVRMLEELKDPNLKDFLAFLDKMGIKR